MSDFIINKLSQLATMTNDRNSADEDKLTEEFTDSATEPFLPQPYKYLSAELWLLIFSNLDRNDLDSCDLVCTGWHNLIRYNNKYLAGREIDYIIFSSKRVFSMTLSSGSIIKVYKVGKYFNGRTINEPINAGSSMVVETYIRTQKQTKLPPGESQLQHYLSELRELINGSKEKADDASKAIKYSALDSIGLHCPSRFAKTSYKISTPPRFFFELLNKLLRNLDHVNFWLFQSFTLTTAFVEKFMQYVEPVITTREVRLIRVKRSKVNRRAMLFFLSVLLGNKTILDKLTADGDPIITTD